MEVVARPTVHGVVAATARDDIGGVRSRDDIVARCARRRDQHSSDIGLRPVRAVGELDLFDALAEVVVDLILQQDGAAVTGAGRAFGNHQRQIVAVSDETYVGWIEPHQHQRIDRAEIAAGGLDQRIVAMAASNDVVGVETGDSIVAGGRGLRQHLQAQVVLGPDGAIVKGDLFDALAEIVIKFIFEQNRAAVAGPRRAFGEHQGEVVAGTDKADTGGTNVMKHQRINCAEIAAGGLDDRIVAVAAGIDIGVVARPADQRIVAMAASDDVVGVETGDGIVAGGRGLGQHLQAQVVLGPDGAIVKGDLFDTLAEVIVEFVLELDRAAVTGPRRAFGEHQGEVIAGTDQADTGGTDAMEHQRIERTGLGIGDFGNHIVTIAARVNVGVILATAGEVVVALAASERVRIGEAVDRIIAVGARAGIEIMDDVFPRQYGAVGEFEALDAIGPNVEQAIEDAELAFDGQHIAGTVDGDLQIFRIAIVGERNIGD